MGLGNGHAIRIFVNEACLAQRGIDADALLALFTSAGLQAEVTALPRDPDALAALAAALRADPPVVAVAAGGDGTVHEVVNMVAPLRIPLGVLPLGTANDFARGLGIPSDPAEAVQVIADETPISIDLGVMNGELFVNAAHLGLGVETAKRTDPSLKRWLGPLAYGMAALQAWRESEPLRVELCADGHCSRILASQVLVGAGLYFGGGNQIGKPSLDNGLLEVYALAPDMGAGELLEVAAALRLGTLADVANAVHFRTATLTIKLSRATEVNMDGELVDCDRTLEFGLYPGGLSVYAKGTSAEAALDPWRAGAEMA